MSRIGQWVVEQEENGKLFYNELTGIYEPVTPKPPVAVCHLCNKPTTDPIEDTDGEAICLDCHTSRRDIYKDALDDMFGNPMEKLEGLGVVK